MSTSNIPRPGPGLLLHGIWTVDPAKSELGFAARGTFGLVKVKGTFSSFDGYLTVQPSGAHGGLTIEAASLDTDNKRLDEHLRSEDFFAVGRYPEVLFELTGVGPRSAGGPQLIGVLQVKETRLTVTAPLDVQAVDGGHLRLSTKLTVDRNAIGLHWNRMGIIRGPFHLRASVELART